LVHKCKNPSSYNQKLEGCIVLNEHNTVFALSAPLYATGVSWAHQSSTQTASRSLQPFCRGSLSLGDRLTETDRPRYSVGNNSAQWRSQILLLSMATTSIYWPVDSNTPCLPFLCKRSPDGATHNLGRGHPIAPYYSSIDPKWMKG